MKMDNCCIGQSFYFIMGIYLDRQVRVGDLAGMDGHRFQMLLGIVFCISFGLVIPIHADAEPAEAPKNSK